MTSRGGSTPGRCTGVLVLALSVSLLLACSPSEAPRAAPPAIVFDWLRDGNRDIYRAALDGTDTVRLTSDPGDDQYPTERAGTVVFTSYRDGNGELYAVPLTGGGAARRLTNTAANETQPALSPDGRHIAYLSDESGVPKLWLCAADGTNPEPLTAGFGFAGSVEASPSWAPSGDRLVFVSTAHGHAGLFVLTLGAGDPVSLVDDSSTAVEPSWSADGRLVAFASNRAGVTNIFTVDVATLAIRQVTTDTATAGQPAWLADGGFVYTSWRGATPRLRWRNITASGSPVTIDLGAGDVQHAAPVY